MPNLIETLEERAECHAALKRMAERVDAEKREMTDDEKIEWGRLTRKAVVLTNEADGMQVIDPLAPGPLFGSDGSNAIPIGDNQRTEDRASWFDRETGKRVDLLRNDESVARSVPGRPARPNVIGRFLCDSLKGERSLVTADEFRDLSGVEDLKGGLLVDPVSAQILDGVRSESVALKAGARTLVMDGPEVRIAKVDSDPTAAWLSENVLQTTGDMTFGSATLRARTIRVAIPVSEELLADAPNAPAAIQNAIQSSMALALDKAILFGSATGTGEEPIGIRNLTGVAEQSSVGALTNYDPFLTAVENCRTNDARGQLSLVAHPRTYADLWRLKTGITSDQSTLVPPPVYSELNRFSTTSISITEGTNESFAIVGPFDQIIVGMRLGFQVIADRFQSATQYQRVILGVGRFDVIVPRPQFFTVLTGIAS